MRLLLVLALIVSALSCRKAPPVADAGVSVDAAAEVDAGASKNLELQLEAKLLDGGTVLLPGNAEAPVRLDPANGLVVTTNLPLRNYRIRLFDEADRAVPSDDRAEDLAQALRYELTLQEPLKSGYRYALVLDAQSGAQMVDLQGNTHPDVRLGLQINGEKQKPAPKKQPAKKRKKKR